MYSIYFLFVSFASVTTVQFSADSLKAQYIKGWQRVKVYTKEYLDAKPKDKYNYRPQDSIRTFVQQMIHLAQGVISLMSAGTSKNVPDIINRRRLEQTNLYADSIIFFVNLSYDFAIEAVAEFDMNKYAKKVKRGYFDKQKLAWVMQAFEHQTHHRGQTTIFISMLGLKPPNEKLF